MKNFILKSFFALVICAQLICCADRFSSKFTLELPPIPDSWEYLLGEPKWRVEWIDQNGHKQIIDITRGNQEIELPSTWTNPVTAWPYWSQHNLIPGLFKPAGALFPYDVRGGKIYLTWEAGFDTVFYWELIHAQRQIYMDTGYNNSRMPANFDWLRFRELFETDLLNEAVREDPWLIDWRFVAERTVISGFDRRRLVPQETELKTFNVPSDLWYGCSLFEKPLYFTEGETPVFSVRPGMNVWVSAKGILRVNGNAWVFTGRENH
ncbi:MAG: hypothetical protein FWD47_05240 [Treponema sp.]|nr:hypothetical protein [Treponema sp.]